MSPSIACFSILISAVFCQSPWDYPNLSWNKEFVSSGWNKLNPHQMFEDWKIYQNRTYNTLEEENYRFSVWQSRMDDDIANDTKKINEMSQINFEKYAFYFYIR